MFYCITFYVDKWQGEFIRAGVFIRITKELLFSMI